MRLGWIGYVVATLVLVAGIVGAVFFISSRLGEMQNAFTRVVVPGSIDLTLDRLGTYTVFHEPSSVIDGKLFRAESISGLEVTVTSVEDGRRLALTAPMGSETYSMGGHSGTAILVFTVAKPGRYRLAAAYPDQRAEPRTVLAVSRGFVGSLMSTIFGTLGLGFGSVALATAIGLATFFLGRRAKARSARPTRVP